MNNNDNLHKILTSVPVNKNAKLVTNQKNCSDSIEMNRIIDEKRQLRKNVRLWMQESTVSVKNKKKLRPLIRQASKRLTEINKLLQIDKQAKFSCKFDSYNDVFVYIAKRTFSSEILQEIHRQAKEIWDYGDID